MTSFFVIINILLLLSASLLQARYRAHSKRRYSMPSQSFLPAYPLNDNNHFGDTDDFQGINNEDSWMDLPKETTTTPPVSTTKSPQNQASEEQIEQFARLLFERLNIKEPPNVTVNVNDDTGFPSSIFKQFEQHRLHEADETSSYRQQKVQEEIMPTAERAILPGDYIANHTCKQQLSGKLNLADEQLQNVDCFRFTKSTKESKSLPTNQLITQLRLYVKQNYFHIDEQQQHKITPDMFHIYQVFRPTSNDTIQSPPGQLTDTTRLSISQVKELNDNWFELTIESNNEDTNLQQLYKQLIMPLYAIAIDRDLRSSSPVERSLSPFNRHHYRQFHSKKYTPYSVRSDDENSKESQQQQLPYMLVEYGEKIFSSSSGRRSTRNVIARPARGCHPSSPCCRRSLIIDLDQGSNALNFVIYPRQLDIGECVGLCGTSGSPLKHTDVKNALHRNEQDSPYNMLLLQSSLYANRSASATEMTRPEPYSPQCCSYSRTGGLELMYTTNNGGPIIRKYIPNMVVEECKCGLPATIQQV